ncbi:MAG: hypothetical protein Q7S12_00795 [bacterium]|nr:hypothetical protein [bacterium]
MQKNFSLILTIILSLVVGFIIGFYVNQAKVANLQTVVDKFIAEKKALENTTAPSRAGSSVPPGVINNLTAPTQ